MITSQKKPFCFEQIPLLHTIHFVSISVSGYSSDGTVNFFNFWQHLHQKNRDQSPLSWNDNSEEKVNLIAPSTLKALVCRVPGGVGWCGHTKYNITLLHSTSWHNLQSKEAVYTVSSQFHPQRNGQSEPEVVTRKMSPWMSLIQEMLSWVWYCQTGPESPIRIHVMV